MTIETELAGTNRRMDAILANNSFFASLESAGALHIPSNTAFDAGMLAVHPNCSKSSLLQIGALPARVYHFLCASQNMVCSTMSWVLCSIIAPS